VTNAGSESWNAAGANNVRLSVSFGGASDYYWDYVTDQRFMLPADVAPGASATVAVTVTAPVVGGSYTLRHRMVKEAVAWFDQMQRTSVTVN
jgi:hypothetical protein